MEQVLTEVRMCSFYECTRATRCEVRMERALIWFNTRTGASVDLPVIPGNVLEKDGSPSAAALTATESKGAFAASGRPLQLDGLEHLAAIKESCIVTNGGFFLLTVLLSIAVVVETVRSRSRQQAQ